MITPESIEVTKRFYQALDKLILEKKLRGTQTFCRKYGIDKRNFYSFRKRVETFHLPVAWLLLLVNDYGVSSEWLLKGK